MLAVLLLALAAPSQRSYDFYFAVSGDWQWGTGSYNQRLIAGVAPLIGRYWNPMPVAWLQPGDLTQWATQPEFDFADLVLRHITVPSFVCYGNHDLDSYPPAWPANLQGWSTLSTPHNLPSRYDQFQTPLGPVAVLSIGYQLPDAHIAWARQQLDANPTVPVILLTHSWLNRAGPQGSNVPGAALGTGGSDVDHATTNSAVQAWEKLVEPYPQIRMVLCGHAYGISRRTDVTRLGTTVLSHLFNPQGDPYGGVEWLRLLAIRGRTIDIYTFAPSGAVSTLNRNEIEYGIDLGQALTDPVDLVRHRSGQDFEDTWIRPIWGGNATNPAADLLYGARQSGPATAQEIGLLKLRAPVAGRRFMLTMTKEGYQSSGSLAFHPMRRAWTDQDSWNSLGGLQPGVDYDTAPAFTLPEGKGTYNLEVAGVPRHGWAILGISASRGGIRSSEHAEGPLLTIQP
jgi:hypothetical protein